MKTLIEARNLVKKYDNKVVVDGIHFEVKEGECFGILGPNGAGKTSTMKMAYGSTRVDEGELFVLGLNIKDHSKKIKKEIGVVSQEDGLDPDFTVLENLQVYSKYFGLPSQMASRKAKELLRSMLLEDYMNMSCDSLSGGLKRRLVIARALINDPKVIFLDEPTTGLDPQARVWIWEALSKLKKKGLSLVLTTHYMEEAEYLCDRIVIMDEGRFIAEGAPKQLILEEVGVEVVEFVAESADDMAYYIKKIEDQYSHQVLNNKVKLFISPDQSGRKAMDLVSSHNMQIRKATLDDVFLKLTGYEMRL